MQPMRVNRVTHGAAILAVFLGVHSPAFAQDADQVLPAGIDLVLNSVRPAEAGGCRLTFVIRNEMETEIGQLVLETVLFDRAGQVATLTLFDFGTLPAARPRVRQFDVGALTCDGIGQVLVNGIATCSGVGLSPAFCLQGLQVRSETDVGVTG